jgi:hypothetical protein
MARFGKACFVPLVHSAPVGMTELRRSKLPTQAKSGLEWATHSCSHNGNLLRGGPPLRFLKSPKEFREAPFPKREIPLTPTLESTFPLLYVHSGTDRMFHVEHFAQIALMFHVEHISTLYGSETVPA